MDAREKWMRVALDQARRGEGLTRPNPPVGAVIVRNGRKVAEGFHRRHGGPHAEVAALDAAGAKARGAEIYVTLEPCSTHGKTPPCTDAILAAGIARAVVAVADPNPAHAGQGLEILRRGGVEVDLGICGGEALDLLEPFAKWIRHRRPWLTLKLGMTVDGRIADLRGSSKWITSSASRTEVQAMRRKADGIMVGARTARADDPSLLPRPAYGRSPYRIVLASNGRLPLGLKMFSDRHVGRTIVATTPAAAHAWIEDLKGRGVQVWLLPSRSGRVSLKTLMKRLGSLGLLHVLCEGGGELASELADQDLVDEYRFFIAPAMLGGGGRPAVGGKGWPMRGAKRLAFVETRDLGGDIMIRARRDSIV